MAEGKKKKRLARVDRDLCASCGCCRKVCPREAISIYKGLYALVDEALCIGCKKCAKECPASIIEIREVDR
ncbi:MAG: 4Fe-4S binding protein [Ruminiclostridium sp.]|nr:4Fe-4S binding protein [Ruminiclostridium sp.]